MRYLYFSLLVLIKRNFLFNYLQQVVKQKSVLKNAFKKLSKPTDGWFPYPVILDKDLSDPLKRRALFEMEPDEVHGGHAQRSWDQIVGDVLAAALVVDPWMMHTREVKHFLGFIDDALHPEKRLGRYWTALEYAKKQLPPGKYELYAAYNAAADVGVQRSDYEIGRELVRSFKALCNVTLIFINLQV